MKLKTRTGEIVGSELFSLVWKGFFFGALVFLLPMSIIMGVFALTSGEGNWWLLMWMPVVAVFQSIFLGLLIGGLVLHRPVESASAEPPVSALAAHRLKTTPYSSHSESSII